MKVYQVGGCVRDMVIGKQPKDFDLVVRVFKEFFDIGNVSTELLN